MLINAGIAFAVLFKNKSRTKENLAIFFTMFAVSVLFAYIISAIFKFDVLHI